MHCKESLNRQCESIRTHTDAKCIQDLRIRWSHHSLQSAQGVQGPEE